MVDRFEGRLQTALACAVAGLFILRKIKNDAGFAAVISTEVPPPRAVKILFHAPPTPTGAAHGHSKPQDDPQQSDVDGQRDRALAMDAVQQANSGHPGAPMGMAEIAVALWGRHLKHNPANPLWPDRDRFVLSNGHASMLVYALLHLSGYDLALSELRNFRQLHSKTPGHPEVGVTPGIETTTGPLGQGLSNAVGMALAEKLLAAEFNRPATPWSTTAATSSWATAA